MSVKQTVVEKVSGNTRKKYTWARQWKNKQGDKEIFLGIASDICVKASTNNYQRVFRWWHLNIYQEAKVEYERSLKTISWLSYNPGKYAEKIYLLESKIRKYEREWLMPPLEKVFDNWTRRFDAYDDITIKDKSAMFMSSMGKHDAIIMYFDKHFKDNHQINRRSAPYGTQSRYDENQFVIYDTLAKKLPSFKKNKKAKAKANKKTFRSNAKKEIKQGLDDYNHYRLMSAKEGFVAYWYGSKAAVQLRALMHDDVYVTFYCYDELEEIMSHLKQSENWEWHLEHVIPNHYLRPGEVCEKVYDYVIQDGRLVKTGYVNYNPMYRKEKVIDYNADAGDWGDYDDNWYDWYD